jgi:hypothetical protein
LRYAEREDSKGKCSAELTVLTHNVIYGSSGYGGTTRRAWNLSSKPISSKVRKVTHDNGQAAFEQLRKDGEALRPTGKTLDLCFQEIDQLVQRNLQK